MNNNELYHYGVPGMRWGVRRADAKAQRVDTRAKKRGWSEDATESAKIRIKKTNQMSNQELKKINQRQELEQKHKQLNPSAIKKGLAIVGATAAALGTITALYTNGKKIMEIGKKVVDKNKSVKISRDSKVFWKGMGKASRQVNEFKNFTFARR